MAEYLDDLMGEGETVELDMIPPPKDNMEKPLKQVTVPYVRENGTIVNLRYDVYQGRDPGEVIYFLCPGQRW